MKEASGELSMTAITVVAIAAIAVVFTTLIWPGMKKTIERNTNCSQSFNCTCPGTRKAPLCDCTYLDKADKPANIECPDNSN